MKVDWDSYERAGKALKDLFSIKRNKEWKRI
jgi:plasmid maintenance system killer protein